ncbi:unnamed protein product [Candidula unifasciata]|uniref:Uncharacterized protein n=1 Tax=Candidula unifasciata TaxID=100452 RepID=A0A8S3YQJ0_9EUPU|nr:unnamed protein product [Candidula unifasciata]
MAANISGSNITNATTYTDFENQWQILLSVFRGNQVFTSVVGSVVNLWFLAAILSSPEVRSRLRNKIICNRFILHLLNCTIILPNSIHLTGQRIISCLHYAIVDNLVLMHQLIANWLLVMLLAVFIAQIEGFNPRTRLSPKSAILGTAVLLVFPWIASLVIVPVIIHEYTKHLKTSWACFFTAGLDSLQVFRSIDTALPIFLAVLLVIIAAVLRRRRFALGNTSGSIQAELFEPGPEIDNTLPYVVAVVVSTACDLLRLILDLNHPTFADEFWPFMRTWVAATILNESRALLMPITFLLLPDIRQRIKTWRPWPSARTDLTVTFHKETN